MIQDKVNIAEILKNCPKGMELNCTVFENLEFDHIDKDNKTYPIICRVKTEWGSYNVHTFTEYGCYSTEKYSKCVIFPKGKTTWEGFVPPCMFKDGDWITNGDYTWKVISVDNLDYTLQNQFGEYVDDTIDYVNKAFHLWTINDAKDGDVLFHSDSASNGIFIFNKILQRGTTQKVICYCYCDSEDGFCLGENHTCCWTDSKILHPATKEQRDILFQKIKEAGYEWVSETKTLLKVIKPKFKVGDRVQNKNTNMIGTINLIINDGYRVSLKNGGITYILFEFQDEWELAPSKFNITTLKPFDKVLVRNDNSCVWKCNLYSHYSEYPYHYICVDTGYKQCIPYEAYKELLGTTNNPKEHGDN